MSASATATMRSGTHVLLRALTSKTFGPLAVLIGFCIIFALTTNTFLVAGNLGIVAQQSVIEGTLAIGQTIIMLTAGIDLADGGIAVFGTIVAARLVDAHGPFAAL